MSENIMMCKIARFCTFLYAILTNYVRAFHLLTKYIILDAKIAHSPLKLCAILYCNVQNCTSRGPNPIPDTVSKLTKHTVSLSEVSLHVLLILFKGKQKAAK